MIYLLDTNACIGHLTGRAPRVSEQLKQLSPSNVVLCSVVKAELWYGAQKSARSKENLATLERFFAPFASLPLDDHAAEICGQIRAELERQGTPIGPNDLLIASIAVAHGLTLVTRNIKEFSRISGLQIESWE